MSLIGTDLAVVSLGCSCQTAWQINRHAEALSAVAGETLARAAMPYDWLIAPPRAVVSWIEAGTLFPESPEEIVVHPNFGWPRHGVYFWHEFERDGQPAVAATFETTRSKFHHLFANLHRINFCRRRLFVVSNTQSNLDEVGSVAGIDFTLDLAGAQRLVETIETRVPGTNEFLFVADPARVSADLIGSDLDVRLLDGRASDVFGDPGRWLALLADRVAPPAGDRGGVLPRAGALAVAG